MIDKIIKVIIWGFSILFPIFYLTVTPDSYEYNKMALLAVTAAVLFLLTAIKIVRERRILWPNNRFTPPLFFLAMLVLISTLFQSPNLTLALTTPLSASTIVAGFLLFILLVYNHREGDVKKILGLLVIDACIISLFVLLQLGGILPDNSYTPAGTLLATTMFLAIITVYLVINLIIYLTSFFAGGRGEKLESKFLLPFLSLLLIAGTAIFLTVKLFTSAKPIILPLEFGWPIFLEVLKNPKTLLLGVGPTNFITAFTMTKPLAFNATAYWNIIFTSSSSFLLTLATEAGLLAGLLYLTIFVKSLKLLKQPATRNPQPITITLLFSLLLLIFLPGNMTVFITVIILLTAFTSKQTPREFKFPKIGKLSYLFLLSVLLLVGTLGYFGAKYYWAEFSFKQSLDALLSGKGEEAYRKQDLAVSLNPQIDRYRVAFSRTSLALANAIASRKELSDTDKQNIPNLVKQAIDQARTAVVLNRTNETNWDNLGRIYSAIIGYAQGAENWTAYSFQQKLILDPGNPNTYIDLAGLNVQLANWTDAENLARRAIFLKPDLANAHYFLNVSLQGQKKYKEAYDELKKAYALLSPDSNDAKKVTQELEQLAKLLPKEETTGAAKLTPSAKQSQTLETNQSSSSAIQGVPVLLPTISLPQPPQ